MIRPREAAPHLRRTLGRLDVVLMIVAGLVSLNTMAPLVQSGPVVLWLWPLAIISFFIPQAITVIELSRHYPGEGAVYVWPSRLLGEMHGFLSGWCYWMANIVYVPTLVVSSVGLSAYMFGASGEALATHGVAIEIGSFALLSLLIWLNIRGLAAEKLLVNVAALGTFTVGIILIGLTGWLAVRHGVSVARLVWRPSGFDWHLISVFSLLCFSLLGLEIASNVGDEIRDPRQTLPRAFAHGGSSGGGPRYPAYHLDAARGARGRDESRAGRVGSGRRTRPARQYQLSAPRSRDFSPCRWQARPPRGLRRRHAYPMWRRSRGICLEYSPAFIRAMRRRTSPCCSVADFAPWRSA